MKKRLLWKLGICICTAMLIGAGVYAQGTVMMEPRMAGVSEIMEVAPEEKQAAERRMAGIAEILEEVPEEDEVMGTALAVVSAVKKADKEKRTQNDAGGTEGKERKTEENLWGYSNLGIAHVDNHLNIREQPGEEGKLVGKMSKDTACEILSIEDGWAHIKSGKVEGYASTEFLFTGENAKERAKEVVTTTAIVNTETLKVRGEPSTESIVLTLVPIEEELEVAEVLDGWVKIMLDDEEAYVSAEYVDLEEKLGTAVTLTELKYGQGISNVRVDLVRFAQKYVGNPYVWGGVSLTGGADCSGFVLSVFKNFGVSLPHSSRAQAGYGTKIAPSEAQPGDLFFYAKNGTINHVAIYIGGGQVVHASSPKTGIKISNAYYRTPYTVRRIL